MEVILLILMGIELVILGLLAILTIVNIVFWVVDSVRAIWYAIFTNSTLADSWRFCHYR